MSISTKEYAFLSSQVYGDMEKQALVPDTTIGGKDYGVSEYKIIEIIENKLTGYQGAIYKNESTGELVAAHRGTEMTHGVPEFVKDTLIADGAMVLKTVNTQIPDAMRLMVFA